MSTPRGVADEFERRWLGPLAGWALPGAAPLASPGSGQEAEELVRRATDERLQGLLLAATTAGEVHLPEPALVQLAQAHRSALLWCLHLEHRLLAVQATLAEAGIEPLVVKGPAVAHLDALDPGLRTFADLDLLVKGRDLDATVAVLLAGGARRPWAERRPGFDRRFAKSVTLTFPDGVEVDLHRTLADGAHGFRVPLDDLFDEATTFPVGGRLLACPSTVHRTLHAALHAVLGSPRPRLASLRDLATHLTDPALDLAPVVAEAHRWRCASVLALAVQEADEAVTFAAPAWTTWAGELAVLPAEARTIARQRAEGSGLGRAKLDAVAELPDLRTRAAFLHALAVPTRAHRRTRRRLVPPGRPPAPDR